VPPLYAHDPFLALHQAMQSRWLDLPAALLSTACEGWALALLGLVSFGSLERHAKNLAAAFLPFALALIASGALVQEVKDLVATPRPLAVYGPEQVRVGLEPLYMFGFPSGHSSAVGTFAAYAALVYGRRVRWVIALMVLGGLSRVYVGAHWVADVVGGWALGALLGILAYALAVWASPGGHLAVLRRTYARKAGDGQRVPAGAAPEVPRGP